jgi:hypothetical protein
MSLIVEYYLPASVENRTQRRFEMQVAQGRSQACWQRRHASLAGRRQERYSHSGGLTRCSTRKFNAKPTQQALRLAQVLMPLLIGLPSANLIAAFAK